MGPKTVVSPPVIVIEPLESRPSPSALTTRVPPLMVSVLPSSAMPPPPMPPPESSVVVPVEALTPSSEAVTEVVPPETVMAALSRPS